MEQQYIALAALRFESVIGLAVKAGVLDQGQLLVQLNFGRPSLVIKDLVTAVTKNHFELVLKVAKAVETENKILCRLYEAGLADMPEYRVLIRYRHGTLKGASPQMVRNQYGNEGPRPEISAFLEHEPRISTPISDVESEVLDEVAEAERLVTADL